MNIAIVLWELNINGGTQRQALELALELQKKGHTVDVYCHTYDREKTYKTLCDQLNIHCVVNGSSQKKPSSKPGQRVGVQELIYRAKIYGSLIKNIFSVGKPIEQLAGLITKEHPLSYYDVVNLHDYEVYKVSRILPHHNIVWMMNDMQRMQSPGAPSMHRFIISALQKILIQVEIRNMRTIVVMDQRNKALCAKYYGKSAIVVQSGIDLDMFKQVAIEKKFTTDIYTLFASSIFFPHRRFEDLVDAVELLVQQNHRNIRVIINGLSDRAYEYYLSIQKRIETKGLTSFITIINGMPEESLLRQYAEAHIYIFPNINQTWGLSVFEAMLAGCVCVVSKGAGAHEVLTHGENAMLVEPKSPEQIAETIAFLISNPQKMEQISKNGVAFVKNNLSWAKYADQMLETFTPTPLS